MWSKSYRAFIIWCILFFSSLSFAQQSPARPRPQGQVIELGAIKLEVRIELPQVQVVDKRIAPEFEEVKVEKSFEVELTGKTEQIQFKAITSGRVRPIKDIEALLKRKRF